MSQNFPAPLATHRGSPDTYDGTPPPQPSPLSVVLPPPPIENNTPKEIARIHRLIAEYYWRRHFENNSVDPASFIDRMMTDYANHESDVVGDWVQNMSPLYKSYRACLKYGIDNGTPRKKNEAKQYQGVFSEFEDH